MRKKQSRRFTVLILLFFEANKTHLALETNSTKL